MNVIWGMSDRILTWHESDMGNVGYKPFDFDRYELNVGHWKLKKKENQFFIAHAINDGRNYTLPIVFIDKNWLALGNREFRRASQWE